jgi:AcrR family transcriptional regulator
MRADARRNRSAVLDAGARLLAERPTASMQEIADASGVGRTTVYRHFPAREDLIGALVRQVADEIGDVTDAVMAMDARCADALRRFAHDITALGRRWRFLQAHREDLLAQIRDVDERFLAWVQTRQRAGELRDDVPAVWIVAGVRALLTAAGEEADALGADEAGRLCGETMVSAFVRPDRAGTRPRGGGRAQRPPVGQP